MTDKPYKKNWMDKLWKHDRDEVGDFGHRALMHIPIGLLTGIPIIGGPLQRTFHQYENNEDFWTHDRAWKDYAGEIVGNIITTLTIIGALTWLAIWLIGVL